MLSIYMDQEPVRGQGKKKYGRMSLLDLAGSENVRTSGHGSHAGTLVISVTRQVPGLRRRGRRGQQLHGPRESLG